MTETVVRDWVRLGTVVRQRRRDSNWTQAELAHRAGVSRGWLIRFESGHPTSGTDNVFRILRVLDLELVARPIRRSPEDEVAERYLAELLGDE